MCRTYQRAGWWRARGLVHVHQRHGVLIPYTLPLTPRLPAQVMLNRHDTLVVFGLMLVGLGLIEWLRISYPDSFVATAALRLTGALARTYEVNHAR